jgi:hypothetical protein
MASMTAANNVANLGAQAAQGSAIARTGEELGAYSELGNAIAQGRGADEATNMFNTGQSNNFALANLEAKLRTMGYNDQAIQGIIGQLQGQNARPGPGTQMLAGGTGALAMWAAHHKSGGGDTGYTQSGYIDQDNPIENWQTPGQG